MLQSQYAGSNHETPEKMEHYARTSELVKKRRPEFPILCYSQPTLHRQATGFVEKFPGQVSFAIKSCPLPMMIKDLYEAGVTQFDVASPVEMELVRMVAADAELHYNHPIKSQSEIEHAYRDYGVRHFTLDDFGELEKICSIVPSSTDVELAVRFMLKQRSGLYDFHTKFGADTETAAKLLSEASDRGFKVGLSFHPGSQTALAASYVRHIEAAGEIAAASGAPVVRLNVGGGFPAPYPDSDIDPLAFFFTEIGQARARAFGEKSVALLAEPGRALAAPALSLVSQIKHRRENGDSFLNDGTYGALMELMLVDLRLPIRVFDANGVPRQGAEQAVTLFGPTCDPLDRLPGKHPIPNDTEVGDFIEFGLIGAYTLATMTRFNGYGDYSIAKVDDIFCEAYI